jgi:phosphonate transport system substrate-binding protein
MFLYSLLLAGVLALAQGSPAESPLSTFGKSEKPKVLESTGGAIKIVKEAHPKSITLGLIPSENPMALKKNGALLAKILSEKLGVTVNIFIPKNYQGLIDAMKEKRVDYAFFTAMSFVFAEKQAGAKVLMKKVWDNPFYYSTVYVATNSPVKSLKELKGQSMAFVDEKSTSGFLYPLVALKKAGVDRKDLGAVSFYGTHEKTALALLEKKVQAAAVFADTSDGAKSAFHRFFEKQVLEVRPIWVSDPIPNDPFVVRQDFYDLYPQLTHKMMFAFLDLQENEKENLLKKYLGVTGVMMATSRQYDPVRDLVKELDLKLE